MLGNNFIHIVFIDIGVPNIVGIDDHHGPFIATIQAACSIDAHFALAIQLERFNSILGISTHPLGIVLITAGAPVIALVNTEKNVVLVIAHRRFSFFVK